MGSVIEHVIDVQGALSNTPRAHVLNQIFRFSQSLRRARDAARAIRPRILLPGARISLIIPEGDPVLVHRSVTSLLRQTWSDWDVCLARGTYAEDPADARVRFVDANPMAPESEFLNGALATATGGIVGFIQPGDQLVADALSSAARHIDRHADTDMLYSDEIAVDGAGQMTSHFFKPDWSPHLLLAMNYLGGLVLARRELVARAGEFSADCEGAHAYDFALRVTAMARGIAHLAQPIYLRHAHAPRMSREAGAKVLQRAVARRGIDAIVVPAADETAEPCYRVRCRVQGQPLVSIIIPTRDHGDTLRRCIESIEAKTTYSSYEILVVDHESTDPGTRSYLASLCHRVLPYKGPFNYSKINNAAAAAARGRFLLFLNNDTRVISPDWIESMLEHVQEPGVGIAGAKLLYPDDTVQHAGTIVGYHGSAANYSGLPKDAPGYQGFARVARECSAVTGACMMVRRELFEALRGFDERMDQAWQDVDICLRAGQQGSSVIFTPHALLYHDEGRTRGRFDDSPGERASKRRFQRVHSDFMKRGDPFYNRNFSSQYGFFEFDPVARKDLAVNTPSLIARFVRGCYEKDGHDLRWLPRRCTLLVLTRSTRSQTLSFTLRADRESNYARTPLVVNLRVNGVPASEFRIQSPSELHAIRLRLPHGQLAHAIDIRCSESFVPSALGINADHRRLSLMLSRMAVDSDVLHESGDHVLSHIRGYYHGDKWKWAGPRVELELLASAPEPITIHATIRCHDSGAYGRFPFRVAALADHHEVASVCFNASNQVLGIDIPIDGARPSTHIQLVAESSFVPSRVHHTEDDRELSYVIEQLEVRPGIVAPRKPLPDVAPSAA